MQWIISQRGNVFAFVDGLLNKDFCPWANRYVYWLKQPVGWFAIAALLSFLVGVFVNPNGWILMTVVLAIMTVGVVWPWLAVRTVDAALEPAIEGVHEGDRVELVFRLRNHLPLPQFGISVDGFLDSDVDIAVATPSVALSCVPGLSEATYRFAVSPQDRGHYPMMQPSIACAFPFGLWTARRPLKSVKPLTVWPKVTRLLDELELGGVTAADSGDGIRSGQAGEPLGVRGFRHGDRLRNIHWVHTARTGQMVVCERGGPNRQEVELILDARLGLGEIDPRQTMLLREGLSWRVRLIASLAMQLHARHVHLSLMLGGESHRISCSSRGRRELLDLLAAVPRNGLEVTPLDRNFSPNRMRIVVAPHRLAQYFCMSITGGTERVPGADQRIEMSWSDAEFSDRIARIWREVQYAHRAA